MSGERSNAGDELLATRVDVTMPRSGAAIKDELRQHYRPWRTRCQSETRRGPIVAARRRTLRWGAHFAVAGEHEEVRRLNSLRGPPPRSQRGRSSARSVREWA